MGNTVSSIVGFKKFQTFNQLSKDLRKAAQVEMTEWLTNLHLVQCRHQV